MDSNHTPLPWAYHPTRGYVADAERNDVADVMFDDLGWEAIAANAALIVRAVNNHGRLVAACEKAFAVFDGIDARSDALSGWYAAECRAAVDTLRAAIAAAKEEPNDAP